MKVINLFAGPGAGKSTTAAGLFYLMKLEGMNVELVTEYAKDMVWEKRHNILSDQLYIFAKQHRRVKRVEGQVDWVITDSPLLIALLYGGPDTPEVFDKVVWEFWSTFHNVNFFLQRVKPYSAVGRSQDENEARHIDQSTRDLLDKYQVPYETVVGDAEAPRKILNRIKELVLD